MPSNVLVLNAMVGFELVLQHTPLAVTVAFPSALIFPPQVAVGAMRLLTDEVLREGMVADVNTTSFPYAVPTAFVAYDLT